jgi:hypothetical protein
LPDFVPLSLATLYDQAPAAPNWLHEIKFDGYRMEARLDDGKVQLLTRKRRIGRIASSRSPKRSAAFRPPLRSSTAKSSSKTTRASAISRCCKPI